VNHGTQGGVGCGDPIFDIPLLSAIGAPVERCLLSKGMETYTGVPPQNLDDAHYDMNLRYAGTSGCGITLASGMSVLAFYCPQAWAPDGIELQYQVWGT